MKKSELIKQLNEHTNAINSLQDNVLQLAQQVAMVININKHYTNTTEEKDKEFDTNILFKDCPIMVRNRKEGNYVLRFSTGKNKESYIDGKTSQSANAHSTKWKYIRLPTVEELPVNTKVAYAGNNAPEGIQHFDALLWIKDKSKYSIPYSPEFSDWKDVIAYMILD